MKCPVCGDHLIQLNGRGRPREYHYACKIFRNSIDRAAKAVQEMQFPEDPEERLEASRCLKFELISIINELPTRHYNERDANGRFMKRMETV